MRAVSPIVSAVILLMASIAAGLIVYQYFLNTVNTMADKPVAYSIAEYVPETATIYVTVDNAGTTPITVQASKVSCMNGYTFTHNLTTPITVQGGEKKLIEIPVDQNLCDWPVVLVLMYQAGGKLYTTEPIEVS
ncbi:hypothetical protein [Hyperthermus butylicus]|uniref:Uncharacterized protein n=1 Tax=Hyperthermus butylicus (strain DSM 5456 / JCM 9403 / PLM1-5) TaxID=415426 RepID=A2BLE6_HYPBU|nr:hypothetical protein [Hyperthermus butylicus]ABM80807.1 hypothetical protein Hbut_0959 [Hyperthermus butylicus DSM 5456]